MGNNRKTPGRQRKRRGIFNFVGEVSKILFGTIDDYDANTIMSRSNYSNRVLMT
jgi:hypothetical protein